VSYVVFGGKITVLSRISTSAIPGFVIDIPWKFAKLDSHLKKLMLLIEGFTG
jgi:hypothetical protein